MFNELLEQLFVELSGIDATIVLYGICRRYSLREERVMGIIVLGDRYKFLDTEKEKLLEKYKLVFIPYNFNDYLEIEESIRKIIKDNNYKIVVLNIDGSIHADLIGFLTKLELNGIRFLTIKNFLETYLNKVYIPRDNSDISFLDNIKLFSFSRYIQKRVIDLIVAVPLAIISSPILLYSIYRIKKESPDGSILFKQKRVGLRGEEFECIKFRSMRTDVEFFDHYTQDNDPRIFEWGKIMRKMRIDELPQLWNVIKGDMHIIGPRAEWNELVKKYEKIWPFYHSRHLIRPGITGWAQVNYPYGRNLEDTYQKLMYDLYYIKNWSLLLELKTIFKTVLVMVGRRGV